MPVFTNPWTLLKLLFILISLLTSMTAMAMAAECKNDHTIVVSNAWARPVTNQQMPAAIYLTLTNQSSQPDQLIKVETNIAKKAAIHATMTDGMVLMMRPRETVVIPAKQQVVFMPNDSHIMLMDLSQILAPKSQFQIELNFAKSGCYAVQVTVR
ncbi:MAG: copper chaperone PCu(A)C [Rhodospirillaceae bacterium]|nr:copper chaperone PCu(A)C [Rhodospirillaceae bacterium]